jgi:hypothetical protein
MWLCPCLHLLCKGQRDSGPASNWACAPQFPSGAAGGVIYEVIRAPQHTRLDAACTPIIILHITPPTYFHMTSLETTGAAASRSWPCKSMCMCLARPKLRAATAASCWWWWPAAGGGHLTVQKVACSPLRLIGAPALNPCLFWCSFVSLSWLYWTWNNPLAQAVDLHHVPDQ